MHTHNTPAQRSRIHFVNALRLQVLPNRGLRSVNLHVEDFMGEAQKLVHELGFDSESLTLSGRYEVSSVVDRSDTDATPCILSLEGTSTVPLGRLVALCTRPIDYNSTQPAGLAFAGEGDITVVGPDASRHQQSILCRGSRQSLVLIDESTCRHAAEGSWSKVLRATSAAIVTSKAARRIAAIECEVLAARTLQNVSRGALIMIVSPKRLVYCSRNQVHTMPIDAAISMELALARCSAVVAAGLVRGCDAEQVAFAAVAAIAGETKSSLTELIDAGRELVTAILIRKARLIESRRRARMIAAATISALLLWAVALPWL